MKTTVDISDALFAAAKRYAAERGTTLRAVIEEGLRGVLAEADTTAAFELRDAGVDGAGLSEDFRDGSWERIRAVLYEGRGA